MSYWLVHTLNALQFSMLLFLLSVGLTVVFGLMNFVNLAHGALYALGAYLGWTVFRWTGSYWAAFALAPLLVAGFGALLYAALVGRMRRAGPLDQVLVTFGLVFVLLDLTRILWGDFALDLPAPAGLRGTVGLGPVSYPAYPLFVIGLGLLVACGLWLALERTRLGAAIRASVDNATMAACLGVRVEALFFWMFCFGCALAGLAGVVAAPIFAITPGMGVEILIPTLIVVVVGGLGSLRGALAGSLLVGTVETFGQVLVPELAAVSIYLLLAATLLLRPTGLFPARAV